MPVLKWLPTYTISFFLQDLLAGFTVGLTEIPQGIAYATVAGGFFIKFYKIYENRLILIGLPSHYGLYSGIMGGTLYFLFGGCKDINMGPTAIMSLLIQNKVTTMGPSGAVLITLLSGICIFITGIFHLGMFFLQISTECNL